MRLLVEMLRALRPQQWVKNLFVLAPLVFSANLGQLDELARGGGAFLLFSLLSGCVYLLNDLVDVHSDRRHPTKRYRPIPSGRLPIGVARVQLAVLLTASIGTSFSMGVEFAAVGLGYFVLNVGYTFSLKHIPFVDVLALAGGFILRIVGGAVAIEVPLSIWLGLCTFLLAAYLAMGKRKHELLQTGDDEEPSRRVLQRYELPHLRGAMVGFAVATTLCYGAYTLFGRTRAAFDPQDLLVTLPFVAYGLWRFYQLAAHSEVGEPPTERMLRDGRFLGNIGLWGLLVIGVIYLR